MICVFMRLKSAYQHTKAENKLVFVIYAGVGGGGLCDDHHGIKEKMYKN